VAAGVGSDLTVRIPVGRTGTEGRWTAAAEVPIKVAGGASGTWAAMTCGVIDGSALT
jgi:hypothetical protein